MSPGQEGKEAPEERLFVQGHVASEQAVGSSGELGFPARGGRCWRREAIANPSGASACRSAPTPQCCYFSDSATLQHPGAAKAIGSGRAAAPRPLPLGQTHQPPLGPASLGGADPRLTRTLLRPSFQAVLKSTSDIRAPRIAGRKWQIPGSKRFGISHPCKGDSSWDFFPSRLGLQLQIYFVLCALL